MSLTVGRGPFGHRPAGQLNVALPDRVVLVDPFPRRVRAVREGRVVVDSDDVKLVFVSGTLPRYAFPAAHVTVESEPCAEVDGHVLVAWGAVDAWFEEDERVFVHPRDPYHRIDVLPTSRRVEVRVNGTLLASSTRAKALYETSLPIRYYLPRVDVHVELLQPSPTVTECAYKGAATHWSAVIDGMVTEDVAWSYDGEVRREAEAIQGSIAFYNERVDLDVDGRRQERPETPWSR